MRHRGAAIGVLAAFDRGRDGDAFTAADEQVLRAFAASAANAVAIKQSVEADRLRAAIAASDAERSRWARELHDETLQALGALRVLLASALRRADQGVYEEAMRQAIEDVERGIENLRGIITDLRPSLLDDLGLLPAVEALLDRRRESGLEIVSELDLPDPARGEAGLVSELETAIYRLVQEALTNIIKHAHASHVRISIEQTDQEVVVEVQDDGAGFDMEARTAGFGIAGMRERVYLAGGALDVHSTPGEGTAVRARLPIPARNPSVADQVAS
jgi:signal transduction histidine kinase